MEDTRFLTFYSNKKKIVISTGKILYVHMNGNNAEVHALDGKVYTARRTFGQMVEELGDDFIPIHRGSVVAAMAIHEITDRVYLNNGESLVYAMRKKEFIINRLHEIQERMINKLKRDSSPQTEEDYRQHYGCFENIPIAFTDIELIFNNDTRAVDWVFRYGNPALASLERIPLENLIGHSFGSIFPNMDSKWLRSYERAVLYGETLEIVDYSPEIDAYLKVICFPTFCGHCGCILFNISDIKFAKTSSDAEKALSLYFEQLKIDNTPTAEG